MSAPHVHAIKLTLHSWELPSWPLEHLRASTAGAMRMAFLDFYPDAKIEIAYNAAPSSDVLNPLTGTATVRGAQLDVDVRGGTEHERHMMQHRVANTLEGAMRRVLQMFIEHDAVSRYRQLKAAYKTYNDVDEPLRARVGGGILT